MSGEATRVSVMGMIDLALDVAYHEGTDRDLAVAAEAYTLAGFHDEAIDISHAGGHDAVLERVAVARKGRNRRLLRADARGMVAAFTAIADAGLVDCAAAWRANNERWKARGGHRPSAAAAGEDTP